MLSLESEENAIRSGRKVMPCSMGRPNSLQESWMKSIVCFLMVFCSPCTGTSGRMNRINTPSSTSRIISDGFLFVFSSWISLGVIDFTADSASCRKGRAACNSLFASSLSFPISSAFFIHASFCTPTSWAFLSALAASLCTFTSRALVSFSATSRFFSSSRRLTFIFSTSAAASFSFCNPKFTLRSSSFTSLYFIWYSVL
mmetsp:Transcript_38909/g.101826  ORF Transcript_38909/g.101826 Transcript_38909/m.101826 type:complete len:200 (+) Transcript_38909:451-1050(+)